MVVSSVPGNSVELRSRVATLRKELASTTESYYAAKRVKRGTEVSELLRRRSKLIRELFRAQSECFLAMRVEAAETVH